MKKITSLKLSILLVLAIIIGSCAGDEKSDDIPSVNVETIEVKNITANSAVIVARVNSNIEKAIVSYGICVSREMNPTIENVKIEEQGGTTGEYSRTFENLIPNTKYYSRSYVLTDAGIIYGNEISFVTTPNSKPIVSTGTVTMITSKTASTGGTVVNKGTSEVVGYGVYISSTNLIPTTTDRDIQGIIDSNKFICTLNNLEPNTKYYIRAYAINTSGISFGEVVSFTTEKVGLTSILTNQPISIYTSTAKVGGTIVSDGGSKFSSVGVCISAVNSIPNISDAKTDVISTSENVFEINLSDLKPNTKYYTRAFCTNGLGTFYGEVISFTTKEPGVPVLKISILTGSGLVANCGTLVTNGGAVITSYGYVWSKFENPDITWKDVYKTKEEGVFPNLTYFSGTLIGGIFPNTTHYVRAYATNIYGTGYSDALRFTTGKN